MPPGVFALLMPPSTPARLLLYDPYLGGHHADHLEWLGTAWRKWEIPGELIIAASPALFERHQTVSALGGDGGRGRVRLRPLPEAVPFEQPMSLVESAVRHRSLISRLLTQDAPERLFAMYLDHAQLAFALHRQADTRLSGLLFRPELHQEAPSPRTAAERVRQARKKTLLRAMMSSPSTEAVFTLDPTAVEGLRSVSTHARIYAVPDPAPVGDPHGTPRDVREWYGVEPGRSLWVLPGALDDRKGVFVLAEAVSRLPLHVQRRLCLVLSGDATSAAVAPRIEAAVDALRAGTEVQVVWDRRFLPEGELQSAIAQADVVLAPYLDHVGSSGIVMRAAAAGRPIVAQAGGLVGWQVRAHGLGRTVNPKDSDAFVASLADAIDCPSRGFDAARAAVFAAAHTTGAYSEAILGPLGLLPHGQPDR